jgi:DNA-binding transcriptional LysR family regulator
MFIAQATLSQQIRRLEEIVGTPLLQRRREGLRLTRAGTVLLDASRNTLSLLDHGVSSTRQAAGLGRPRLRVVVPSHLPNALAVEAASALRLAAAAADADVVWMETPLDAEFSLIRQHRADAGLGWLTAGPDALAAPLQVMSLGEFTDPPFRHSLSLALAFAATGDRPAAVLTGPSVIAGTTRPAPIRLPQSAGIDDMVRVTIDNHPLTAMAALVWSGDLPRPLQQILYETADGVTSPAQARGAELMAGSVRRA